MGDSGKEIVNNKDSKKKSVKRIVIQVGLLVAFYLFLLFFMGWAAALVLMICLLIHECGHIWAMKRCGIELGGLYFLPGIGAIAVVKNRYLNRADEAYMAIMGPVWGAIAGVVAWFLFSITGWLYFELAIVFCAMLNLFNLLPLAPLDGGRVLRSVAHGLAPRVAVWLNWLLFFSIVLLLLLKVSLGIALLIAIFALDEQRRYSLQVKKERDYRRIKQAVAEAGPRLQELLRAAEVTCDTSGQYTRDEKKQACRFLDAGTGYDQQLLELVSTARDSYFFFRPFGWFVVTNDYNFASPVGLYRYLRDYRPDESMTYSKSFAYMGALVVLLGVLSALFVAYVLPFIQLLMQSGYNL